MSTSRLDPIERATRYAKSRGLTIEGNFGFGRDGYVLSTNKSTAVKAFRHHKLYQQELEIYEYLQRWNIFEVSGFHIPQLVSFDPGLSVIEMSVVAPPFILDFVQARIEIPIEFDDDWIREKEDLFEDDWPRVRIAIWQLSEHGIYLDDVHPGNIRCR